MKKQLLISAFMLCIPLTIFAQGTKQPTNVILTPTEISGNADFKTTVKVDVDNDSTIDYSIVVNYQGYFQFTFPAAIRPNAAGVYPDVAIWTVDYAVPPIPSNRLVEKPLLAATLLRQIANGTKTIPLTVAPPAAVPINPTLAEKQPKSTTYNYKVKIANTAFSIPIVRFNMVRGNTEFKTGDITLFSSVGFGASMNWGELTMTSDEKSDIINREFVNSFGMGIGILYAAGSGEEPKNMFAINPFMSFLDIQLGVGYELGTVIGDQSKFFFTASYSIPLQNLSKGKYYVYRASNGYNSENPLTGSVERDTEINSFK